MKIGNYPQVIREQFILRAAAKKQHQPLVTTFTDAEVSCQRQESIMLHSQRCGGGRRILRKKIGGE